MDKAAAEEKQRKAAAADASRKRSSSAAPTPEGPDAKRVKLEASNAATAATFLSGFDFTTLPAALVTELIVANIQVFSDPALAELVQTYKNNRVTAQVAAATAAPTPTTAAVPVAAAGPSASNTPPTAPSRAETPPPDAPQNATAAARTNSPPKAPAAMLAAREVKDEPVDPLQMDIDEDEIEYEPDRLNIEVICSLLTSILSAF